MYITKIKLTSHYSSLFINQSYNKIILKHHYVPITQYQLSHTKPIPPIIKKNVIKIISPLLKTGIVCLQWQDMISFTCEGYHTVKPEIFTTFLFSRLLRITKIREIKKSGKILPFFKSDNEVWGV